MKKVKITVAAMLLTFSLSAASCVSNNENNLIDNTTEKVLIETVAELSEPTAVKEVIFKKGTLIEIAFLSVKPGKEKQFTEEYFPAVMPIVTEYGGKPLMTIGVQNNYSEEIKVQMAVFFEWPSAAKKEAFNKDPRFLKAKKIRDAALSYLKVSYFEVAEDSPVKLDQNKFYELYGMTLNKEKGHLMQTYFEKVGPIVTGDYGVAFPLALSPVKVAGRKHYVPQTMGLAIWPSAKSNAKFFGSKEYNDVKHFKEDALERIDVWQGAVML